ncbi:MAG TPA: winged helix-turn-helix domain-containing protein [Vicinamibacterales bacterium]|nr:winged helix-turn-helix domain-containing protein [Vicinamibacterales bacterium]
MRFGEFDVDAASGVLTRAGSRVKLQDLPFRLLVALLRRPGDVVTREELRAELWGAETFVDAEAGLNTAIGKLREALGDNAETPRLIQTLPKRGYRFIGTLVQVQPRSGDATAEQAARRPASLEPSRRAVFGLLALTFIVMALTGYRAYSTPGRVTLAVVRFHNETGDAAFDRLAGTLTDAVVVALAQDPEYAVIGNSPLLRTDRIFQDVRRIGDALNADFVVLGQLQKGDAGLLVRAHFIRPTDDKHFWANKIDIEGAPDTEARVTAMVTGGVAVGLKRAAEPGAGR